MFNMTKIKAASQAGKAFYANHLAANDYYSEHDKVEGYWYGQLVGDFHLLLDKVTTETFSLFQRNINPVTFGKLTQRTLKKSIRFYDFQCAAPKSVSLLSLLDPRLIEAHDKAVTEAMVELEKLAAVRIRKGENVRTNNFEMTGKIVYASFRHDTSRALDPQLHTHNAVVNVSLDSEGNYKALESVEMCRAIRYAGKVYHNALSRQCREFGYELENRHDEKGNIIWQDIKGVSEELMERFSKRRHQIEEEEAKFILEHGRKPTLAENNYLSLSTRSQKLKHISRTAVREHQLSELGEQDLESLRTIVRRSAFKHGTFTLIELEDAKRILKEVIPLVFERESVVKLDKVLGEALNRNLGVVTLERLKEAAREIEELRPLGGFDANPWVSPQEVIDRELYAIESVENQKDLFPGISPDFEAFPGEAAHKEQAEVVHGLLRNQDRFQLFRGVAGSGKTTTLQELCRGLESGGMKNIYLIAPTNSASDVLRQEGFENSQTVASFLLNSQKPPGGSYVIIDESGLNSLREGADVIKLARENNYRVLFVGDARQHTAVESGDFFRLLEDHSSIARFSLTDIHRQQHEEYRRGIMECALGKFEAAFARFDGNGFIHEDKGDYLSRAAESYVNFTANGQEIERAILVSPTHEEGDRLTEAVREKLKECGSLAKHGRIAEVFRSWNKPKAWLRESGNYTVGMSIAFIRNLKDLGRAGEIAKIERVEEGLLYLDDGRSFNPKTAADFIEVGETREVELCKGDLIQFKVNLRDRKIYNGNIAKITDDPGKVLMLYSDGKPGELVDLPENYGTFQYGWVTTSYKAQGRTAENVVVAAEALDRKAFYVSLSRGRKNLALHCPEKEYLKQQLNLRTGDRLSVHDLIASGEIPAGRILALSRDAQKIKASLLPNVSYKSIHGRAKKLAEYLKGLGKRILERGKRIVSRRAKYTEHGYGPFAEKTLFEMEAEHLIKPVTGVSAESDKSKGVVDPVGEWMDEIERNNPPEPKRKPKVNTPTPEEMLNSMSGEFAKSGVIPEVMESVPEVSKSKGINFAKEKMDKTMLNNQPEPKRKPKVNTPTPEEMLNSMSGEFAKSGVIPEVMESVPEVSKSKGVNSAQERMDEIEHNNPPEPKRKPKVNTPTPEEMLNSMSEEFAKSGVMPESMETTAKAPKSKEGIDPVHESMDGSEPLSVPLQPSLPSKSSQKSYLEDIAAMSVQPIKQAGSSAKRTPEPENMYDWLERTSSEHEAKKAEEEAEREKVARKAAKRAAERQRQREAAEARRQQAEIARESRLAEKLHREHEQTPPEKKPDHGRGMDL